MLRRLYFVLPDIETAKTVERELLLARVEDRRMHFLARDGLNLGELPEASLAQKSDLLHGMWIGFIAGSSAGAIAGAGAYLYFGLNPSQAGVVALLALLGASIGVWISGIIGASIPNIRLKRFAETLKEGHVLLMVDVRPGHIDEVREIIIRNHPDAEDHGLEATVPAFP